MPRARVELAATPSLTKKIATAKKKKGDQSGPPPTKRGGSHNPPPTSAPIAFQNADEMAQYACMLSPEVIISFFNHLERMMAHVQQWDAGNSLATVSQDVQQDTGGSGTHTDPHVVPE